MKLSNEVKVGMIGILTLAIVIWGINYLKGRNIFNSTYTLYAFYSESGGLETSSPVLINGVKVGFIENIVLRTDESPSIKVILNIERQYTFGEGSVAELISADILGTKAIRIATSDKNPLLQDQDTITGIVEPDLISSLQSALFPILEKASLLASSLDTLSGQMALILSQDALSQIIENLADLTNSLKSTLSSGGSLDQSFRNLESFTGMLDQEKGEMASMIKNLNSVSGSLDRAELDSLSAGMTTFLSQLTDLMEQLNSGEGSAGKLIYTDSLYNSMHVLIDDLDSLVLDLKENPKDYVQISVFGKSKK
jgi:phospholipid/cholesterol/gamma-HCH transport system substrate-binding protein